MRKKILLLLAYCLYLNILFAPKSLAAHFQGGFSSGHLTYGISGGVISYAHIAAQQWNNVTPNASYTYSSATNTYGPTAHVVVECNVREGETSGLFGQTFPYKTWTGTSATLAGPYDRYVKAFCYQYIHYKLNTDPKRIHTATHEMGHALSVAHPLLTTTDAVMQIGVRTSYFLEDYDRESLISKWGLY